MMTYSFRVYAVGQAVNRICGFQQRKTRKAAGFSGINAASKAIRHAGGRTDHCLLSTVCFSILLE